jgi:NTP pyrophosphatase (non-canonical NTP hydrolase)
LISTLYGDRLKQTPLPEVALHLLEEMGEVSDGLIRMYTYLEKHLALIADEVAARQIRLEDELADVLSWLLGLVVRLNVEGQSQPQESLSTVPAAISNSRLLLSQILWARYGSDEKRGFRCWSCEDVICSCLIRPIRTESEVEDLRSKLSDSPKAGSA